MSNELFDLNGRVAVVTGGGGVLGSTIAEGLRAAGARLVLLDLDRTAAEKTAAELREMGASEADVKVVVADATDEGQLRSACADVLDAFGQIDILMNAAGGNVTRARTDHKPIFDLPFDAFDQVLRLNLHGTVFPTLVFGEAMAQRQKGSIVNISSMAAIQAISGTMGYGAAKAGIDNFTRWMAVDLARRHGDGLRVNAIAPGFFVTKQNRDVLVNADGTYTERSKLILAGTPMGRFGEASELIGTVVFLCSDAASFVTGAVIPVDGGFNAFSGI